MGGAFLGRPLARVIPIFTAFAFAFLVSVAATHLHVGADADVSCPVCAAFGGGKLERPAPILAVPTPMAVSGFCQGYQAFPQVSGFTPAIIPPSCGPPRLA